MFRLSTKVNSRLLKKSAREIDAFYESKGRKPYLSEIGEIQMLNFPERISFVVLGGLFIFVCFLFVRAQSWIFPLLFVPISGYVVIRGFIGHRLAIRTMDSSSVATPESIASAIEGDFSNTKRTMVTLDIFVAILVVVIELTLTVIGAILSAFT